MVPHVNQLEIHPGFARWDDIAYSEKLGMVVEAWSPMGNGKVLADPVVGEIAARYGKSPAQICIRWCIQHGVLPLPKSVTPSRIAENAQVFDFALSAADMETLDRLDGVGYSGFHPDEVPF